MNARVIENTNMKKEHKYDLISAVRLSLDEVVEAILNEGKDPNQVDIEYNETALMLAVKFGNPHIVSLLLEKGADVNSTDFTGKTALSKVTALYRKNVGRSQIDAEEIMMSALEMLMNSGANPNISDNEGQTPLMNVVALTANVKAVKLLIDKGADVNAVDIAGETALDVARLYGLNEIISLLNEATRVD